jgi:hypothetical protein
MAVMKLLFVGIHYYDVPVDADFTPGLIWIYIVGAVYNPILAIVKQSILIFLLRLGGTKTGVMTTVWVVSAFNVAEMIAVFFTVLFQCTPIELNWKPVMLAEGGHCINQAAFGISTAVLTIVTDVITLAIPIYIFVGLNMKLATKMALIVVFMMGFMYVLCRSIPLLLFKLLLVPAV